MPLMMNRQSYNIQLTMFIVPICKDYTVKARIVHDFGSLSVDMTSKLKSTDSLSNGGNS